MLPARLIMNIARLKFILNKSGDSETVYFVDGNGNVIELMDEHIYHGPLTQEDASIGIDSVLFSTR